MSPKFEKGGKEEEEFCSQHFFILFIKRRNTKKNRKVDQSVLFKLLFWKNSNERDLD